MLGNGTVYAVRKRKKPIQKNVKSPPVDTAVKTNPSKRHRDRLNGELERLTSLLPFSQEVRGRLDKLSVLRLSVGYLKVKSYFHAALQRSEWSAPSRSGSSRAGPPTSMEGVGLSEGDLLLQALNGFVMVVTTDGCIFYTSSTVQDYPGFHQSDVLHQSVYELIHMDDRDTFRCQLHFALHPKQDEEDTTGGAPQSNTKTVSTYLPQHIPPENSSFLERSFCCRFRCLLDNTSGFLALNLQGRLRYVEGCGRTGEGGTATQPQLALFAIATPLLPPSVMEIRTKTLVFLTKHKMDFSPTGIDTRGKVALGYSETDLQTRGSGYEFIHAADMMYCADIHLRMIKTGESGPCVFRLLSKTGVWVWVQANARVILKGGRPDFIVVQQKVLGNEEGEEHLRQRGTQLPFNFATGEAVLYGSCSSLDTSTIPAPSVSSPPEPWDTPRERPLHPASLLGSLSRQDRSVYTQPQEPDPQGLYSPQPLEPDPASDPLLSLERAFLDSHALLSVPGELQDSRRPRPEDPTAQAMVDSLERILGEMWDGGLEGLGVQEAELRDWESALLRVNMEMEGASGELNDMLANDVFSYVEDALKKATNGEDCFNRSEQSGGEEVKVFRAHLPSNQIVVGGVSHHSPPLKSFLSQSSVLPGNRDDYIPNGTYYDPQGQVQTDVNAMLSSFGEQSFLGNVVPAQPRTQTTSGDSLVGNTTRQMQWSSSGVPYVHGNQMVPPPSHNSHHSQPWILSLQNNSLKLDHTLMEIYK